MRRIAAAIAGLLTAVIVASTASAAAAQGNEGYEALEGLIGDTYRNFTESGREGEAPPGGVFQAVETRPVDNFNRQESWGWAGEITGTGVFVGMWNPDSGVANELFAPGRGGLFDCTANTVQHILCPPGDDGSQFAAGAKFFGMQFGGDLFADAVNNVGEIGIRFDRPGVMNFEGSPQFYDLFDGADCFIVSRFDRTGGNANGFEPPVRIDYTPDGANPFPESPTTARVHLQGNVLIFALPLSEPCINADGIGGFTFVAANGFRRKGSVTSYVTPDLPGLFPLDSVVVWDFSMPAPADHRPPAADGATDDAIAPSPASTERSDRNPLWLVPAAIGVLGVAYGVTRVRKQKDETDPTAITEEDLEKYRTLGIDGWDEAAKAKALQEENAADLARAEAHAEQVRAEQASQAAAAQAAIEAEIQPMPHRPGQAYATDSPTVEFIYGFFDELATDFASGGARDRLYYWGTTVDDGFKDGATGFVQSLETAWEGWGNIIDNPSSLGELDDAAGDAVDHLSSKADELHHAALTGDNKRFGEMMGYATGQAEFQVLLAKGVQQGQAALTTRLSGGAVAAEGAAVAATETTAATASESAALGSTRGFTTVIRPPATAPRPPAPSAPRPPAPPPPAPASPTGPAGYGYGQQALRGPTVRGGGTPAQAHPNGCGAAVGRGVLRDVGLAMPNESQILTTAAQLGVWNGGGLTLQGLVRVLHHYLPANARMFGTNMMALPNKAANIARWMALNPTGEVVVGIRWGGAGTRQVGHFVRVEAVRNGWVILGDPQFVTGAIAVPEVVFNFMAEVAVVVVP